MLSKLMGAPFPTLSRYEPLGPLDGAAGAGVGLYERANDGADDRGDNCSKYDDIDTVGRDATDGRERHNDLRAVATWLDTAAPTNANILDLSFLAPLFLSLFL